MWGRCKIHFIIKTQGFKPVDSFGLFPRPNCGIHHFIALRVSMG